ncbi:MAG: hypothetical protein CM1200mP20_07990 [Pseudomonadota bacterium]|nr:MAG: hypothetical protein CM1200mP20_07990 [Pseudomonadota bacterium]
MGRNGMGKTTSVHCIMGIVPTSAGRVLWEDQVITNLPSFRIAQAGIGLVPEGRQVFPNLTVIENLVAAARSGGPPDKSWNVERVFDMFPALAARRDGLGNLLSGGEQQMLAIGRALMTNPRLLILDEATEGLAPLVERKSGPACCASKRRYVHSGDRQKRGRPCPNRRSTLYYRERPNGLVRNLTRTACQ